MVANLREAGADVFATTAVLEYGLGALRPEVPESRNPYALDRVAGGSAGGSAAMVGVGACPVALGTDTSGSIRIAAAYCGIVGFKPSLGTLDTVGVQPLAPSLDHVGLVGRDVDITSRTFEALSGSGPSTAVLAPRLGMIAEQFDDPALDPEVAATLRRTVETLTEAGSVVVEIDKSLFAAIDDTFDDIAFWEMWQVHGAQIRLDPTRFGQSAVRLLQVASQTTELVYRSARQRLGQLLPQMASVYRQAPAILSPAVPLVAPSTARSLDRAERATESMFTRVFNLAGAPALVLQCGWSGAGLPIGLQVSAARGADSTLLATAAWIEATLGIPPRETAV